jgi:hypothetical protein
MSKVKTEEELFRRIEEHQEEIKMLIHNYTEYIVKKHKKQKTIAETERENDNQCLAVLKSKKRCTKKRCEEGPDTELCKLHNKSDTEVHKVELPPTTSSNPTQSDSDSDDEGVIQVKLTVDADGDTLDQEGNIWCLDKQLIIGKKDLRTKHKVFFKAV